MLLARREWLLLPAFALLPLLLYGVLGYGGQDFSYHVTSWIELHNAWSAHEWVLGWSQWAQHGFGEPRFCFYPPFSFFIGTALSFLMPLRLVPGMVVWMVLSLSGLAMYVAAGRFLAHEHRLPAAILYMFNPYLLVTVVVRYAIAEAWVQALLPLVFLYFYIAIAESRLRAAAPLGCLLAFGWLTNIPEAIAIFYALGLLAVVLAVRQRSFRPLLAIALSQSVALGLAAFRLVPTLGEKGWVSSDALLIYDFRAYMQFRHIPPPHMIVFFCGAYMVAACALAFLAARQSAKALQGWSVPVLSLLTLSAFAVFVQLPVSTLLWKALPEFRFVLFPFRFLPLLSLGSVLLLFTESVSQRLRKGGIAVLLLLALFPFVAFTRLFTFQRFPSLAVAAAGWQRGFEGVREYVPAGVPHDRAIPDDEVVLQKQGPFASDACQPALRTSLPNEKVVETSSSRACTLVLNTFRYPFWTAALDSGLALPVEANAQGLIAVAVPGGAHQVTFHFVPTTRTRTAAGIASFVTFLIVMTWVVLAWRRFPPYAFPVMSGKKA